MRRNTNLLKQSALALKKHFSIFLIVFCLYCIFCVTCQGDVFHINGTERTSLSDVLIYQFNIYSYMHLFFLPSFFILFYQFMKTDKNDEFVLTRYSNRFAYFQARQRKTFAFTLIYRIAEIVISSMIFLVSCATNSVEIFPILHVSSEIQAIMCISLTNVLQIIIVCAYVQIGIFLLYFFFAQIVLFSDIIFIGSPISISIPICLNFLLLVLIKANYWFENMDIQYILPHYNTFLEFIFDYRVPVFSTIRLGTSLLYWCATISLAATAYYLRLKRTDYFYPTENSARDMS